MSKYPKCKWVIGLTICLSLISLLYALFSSELLSECKKSHLQAANIKKGMLRSEVYTTLEVAQIGSPASFKSDYGTQISLGEWTEAIPLYRIENFPPGEILILFHDGRVKDFSVREPAAKEILAYLINRVWNKRGNQ